MSEMKTQKYDLEERTFRFAKDVKEYVKKLPKSISTIEYIKQIIRSSASIAANYIEANESLSRKDYFHRVRISRKETKETLLWFKLIDTQTAEEIRLINEANELMHIFGAIITKSTV